MKLKLTSSYYDEEYFEGGKGYPQYHHDDRFGLDADTIIRLFEPVSVLEIGCAKGYLVKELRDRGIPAYGVDISAYAISQCPPEVEDYIYWHDVTEPTKMIFPQVDLIVSNDTFEHIPEDKLDNVVEFMRRFGERFYVKVGTLQTPDWQHDASHVTMHRIEWWMNRYPDIVWEESK